MDEDDEEMMRCPWDYGAKHSDDQEDEEVNEIHDGKETDSNWSDSEQEQEIDSSLKRPGGSILRFSFGSSLHFIFQ